VIAVSVLGVLAFSAEYSTGLIQVTFTAPPRRRAVLAAKAVVLAGLTLAVGEAVAFASFGLDQAILAGHGQGVSLGHPGVPGAVLRAGLLLCVCALHPAADLFSPGWSLLVLLAWPAAGLAAAALLITRRDA
jgi:ABC-2 type transport system permease protein